MVPKLDGLHAIFFQSQQNKVGKSICLLVKEIFLNPVKVKEVNKTFVSLIPKIDHPENIKHFRPISLCNMVHKLVMKKMVNRIRSIMLVVISPQQCSFALGRQGFDNIIIAQEVVHKMRISHGFKGFMAIKIDLKRACDKLSQKFIIDYLKDFDLEGSLINLIWNCISTLSMNVDCNEEWTREFNPGRGIRQGDPLSPYPFVICIERLSHIISLVVSQNIRKPVFLSRRDPLISHLCFAYNIFIFT